jgi:ribosomal protein L17
MNINRTKYKLQGKTAAHRRSIQKSLLLELIRHNSLKTTPAKARILVAEFDKLVTEAKKNTEASQRNVMSVLQNELAYNKLYNTLLPNMQDVNSGYTHQARTLPRKGDNADQVIVLVRGQQVADKGTKLEQLLAKQEAGTEEKAKPARKRAQSKK